MKPFPREDILFVLLGSIAQGLKIPRKMTAVFHGFKHHQSRLLALQHFAIDFFDVELRLDCAAEFFCQRMRRCEIMQFIGIIDEIEQLVRVCGRVNEFPRPAP